MVKEYWKQTWISQSRRQQHGGSSIFWLTFDQQCKNTMTGCSIHYFAITANRNTDRAAVFLHRMCQLVTFRRLTRKEAVLTHVKTEAFQTTIPAHTADKQTSENDTLTCRITRPCSSHYMSYSFYVSMWNDEKMTHGTGVHASICSSLTVQQGVWHDLSAAKCKWFAYRPADASDEVALQQAEMRMVRWMCDIKVNDWVPRVERETIIRWQSWYYSKTGCDGMGMCCEKKTVIGWRNVWSTKCKIKR